MPSEGGDLRRLTYLGALSIPCGWLDAESVLFRSMAYEAHGGVLGLCSVACYVHAAKYRESADLDPRGERSVHSVRGQIHHMRHLDGPVSAHCVPGSRCRRARFLADGRRVIVFIDRDNGDECLEIWDTQDYTVAPVPVPQENGAEAEGWGRFTLLEASPKGEHVAFANHRNELWLLDIGSCTARKLTTNPYGQMGSFAWSPDGRWLAFQQSETRSQHRIAIASVETGEIRAVTEPLFADYSPSFDPEGRYLYFFVPPHAQSGLGRLAVRAVVPQGRASVSCNLKKGHAFPVPRNGFG